MSEAAKLHDHLKSSLQPGGNYIIRKGGAEDCHYLSSISRNGFEITKQRVETVVADNIEKNTVHKWHTWERLVAEIQEQVAISYRMKAPAPLLTSS